MPAYHVALVSTQTSWRGGEEQARQLALGLRSRGHACTVIARAGGAFANYMTREGYCVKTFSGRATSLPSIYEIRRHLSRLSPEVLHTNDSHALTAAGLASLGMPVPLRVASRRVDFPVRSVWKYRLLCDRVVCVSQAVARVCQRGGLPGSMLQVVHSGVDLARMASGNRERGRQAIGVEAHERLLLCVGALTEHKGHAVLLRALPKLLNQHADLTVAIAGDGHLAEPLARQAVELGIASRVRFLGYRADVADLVQACDLFAMPSIEEGLGTAVIDAMCARRPIVATTAGGIPELLPWSSMAWTVPPGNEHALAQAIEQALASPQEARQRAERAEQRARQFFSSAAMVEGMLGIYAQGLEGKAMPRAA